MTAPPPTLGALGQALDLWMALDSTEKGGLTWSRQPQKVLASGPVKQAGGEGKRWLDFSKPGALLTFQPGCQLPPAYTLCIWAQWPMPHEHGLVWQGAAKGEGCALFVGGDGLYGWSGTRNTG